MINSHYGLKVADIRKYKDMKDSPMYRSYVQDIIHSPLFQIITKEHVKYLDVTEDIAKLQHDVKLSPAELNKIFKSAISKMAVSIVADTIIMKEIIDIGVDDAKDDLDSNFMITYLLGLADEKYYKKAEEILEKDPDTHSVLYRGYLEFTKRNSEETETIDLEDGKPKKPPTKSATKKKDSSIKIDISSDQIRL